MPRLPEEPQSRPEAPRPPLRATARRLRRNLLVLSVVVILFATGILRLERTAFLGLELDPRPNATLAWLLIGLLAWWSVSFFFHAAIDVTSWGRRGRPRGFWALVLCPPVLVLDVALPVAAAALATLALQPAWAAEVGLDDVRVAIDEMRDARTLERSSERTARALERAESAQDAEAILTEALSATRSDTELLSDATLLAEDEALLSERIEALRRDAALAAARLAEFQGDVPGALSHYRAALFALLEDEAACEAQADFRATLEGSIQRLESTPEMGPPAAEPDSSAAAASEGERLAAEAESSGV